MNKIVFMAALATIWAIPAGAQVTKINSNNSLRVLTALSNTKAIAVSDTDLSLWVTDGTLAGTVAIAPGVEFETSGGLLAGKLLFRGSMAGTGSELFITDGTTAGTIMVKDIFAGATGSVPADFAFMNGFLYFSAATAAEGRELWRSDGTNAGTTLVKDIIPGTESSNMIGQFHLFSTGTYLLFAANTAATGVELWKSDGSNGGTNLLLDIHTGSAGAASSDPDQFFNFNGVILFTATDAAHGNEIWKTDGTVPGTTMLKDINPGTGNSTSIELFPGFDSPIFFSFHVFNNKAYFNAYDGSSTGQVWSTDGSSVNTTLLKEIIPGTSFSSLVLVIDAVNLPGKFIFPVSDGLGRSELWQSDGTPGGTVLFRSFSPTDPEDIPFIAVPYTYDLPSGSATQALFQGNKFFFSAGTAAAGYELWMSDGSLAGTNMVKDIFPGAGNGIDFSNNVSFLYTSTNLYFAADNGTNGNELWKSDGTVDGTTMISDINVNAADAMPQLAMVVNGKIIFSATDGDHPDALDLFAVDGNSISGNVGLQGRPPAPGVQWQVPVQVEIYNVNGQTPLYSFTTTTNQSGQFVINGIAPGTYKITVKNSHTLRRVIASQQVTPGNTVINFGTLLEGDANNDNRVTLVDLSILVNTFNKFPSDAGYDPRADFNNSGSISLSDFSLLLNNFNLLGENP